MPENNSNNAVLILKSVLFQAILYIKPENGLVATCFLFFPCMTPTCDFHHFVCVGNERVG